MMTDSGTPTSGASTATSVTIIWLVIFPPSVRQTRFSYGVAGAAWTLTTMTTTTAIEPPRTRSYSNDHDTR